MLEELSECKKCYAVDVQGGPLGSHGSQIGSSTRLM